MLCFEVFLLLGVSTFVFKWKHRLGLSFHIQTILSHIKKVVLHSQERYSQNMSSKAAEVEEEEDPYDERIKKSGCAKYHYALQVRPGS